MRSELTSLTGVAGEHYVLFELLRKGYIAALAPTGVPDADIVVTIHCAGGGTQPWVFREHRTMAEVCDGPGCTLLRRSPNERVRM